MVTIVGDGKKKTLKGVANEDNTIIGSDSLGEKIIGGKRLNQMSGGGGHWHEVV